MAAFWRPLTEFSLWWGPKNGRYFFPGFEPGANFFGNRAVIKMMLLMPQMSLMLPMPLMPLMPLMPTMPLMRLMFLMPLMPLMPLMLLMLRVSHYAYDASGPFAPDVAHAFVPLAAPDEILANGFHISHIPHAFDDF